MEALVTTSASDPARSHKLAEDLVRYVAARAAEPTIVTVGESADGIPVVTEEGFAAHRVGGCFEGTLVATAELIRQRPRGIPISACALILPARDLAYLYHHDDAAGVADVVATGPHPIDLPATRAEVSRGLATVMQALTDTRQRPAVASAFLADPTARIGLIPLPAQPDTPAPGGPEQRGPHR
jgi:hypothetical protein